MQCSVSRLIKTSLSVKASIKELIGTMFGNGDGEIADGKVVDDHIKNVTNDHDDRYYTKTESNTKFDEKADKNGSTTETFAVADADDDTMAPNLGQVKQIHQYSALIGPHEYGSQYKNNWHDYYSSDTTIFEAVGSGADEYTGIKVLVPGNYRVRYVQRGDGGTTNTSGWVSLDGDTSAIQSKGVFGMGRVADSGENLESFGIMTLSENDIVSAGTSASDSSVVWGDYNYFGIMTLERIS